MTRPVRGQLWAALRIARPSTWISRQTRVLVHRVLVRMRVIRVSREESRHRPTPLETRASPTTTSVDGPLELRATAMGSPPVSSRMMIQSSSSTNRSRGIRSIRLGTISSLPGRRPTTRHKKTQVSTQDTSSTTVSTARAGRYRAYSLKSWELSQNSSWTDRQPSSHTCLLILS